MNRFTTLLIAVVAGMGCLVSCDMLPQPPSPKEKFFLTEVKPILEQNCLVCHNTNAHPSGLNLTDSHALVSGKGSRMYIVPGRPSSSLLVTAISRNGSHPKMMPRTDLSLTEDQVAVLREWIQDGAAWPSGRRGHLVAKVNAER